MMIAFYCHHYVLPVSPKSSHIVDFCFRPFEYHAHDMLTPPFTNNSPLVFGHLTFH